jgi:hypothetical protein
MGSAGLAYAGSATLTENIDQCAVPMETLPLLSQIADPAVRETVRDFAANKQFRRDVYVRGGSPLMYEERYRAWSQIRFVLAVPRDRVVFSFTGPPHRAQRQSSALRADQWTGSINRRRDSRSCSLSPRITKRASHS